MQRGAIIHASGIQPLHRLRRPHLKTVWDQVLRAQTDVFALEKKSGKLWCQRYHISSCITGATLSVQDYPNVLNPDKWLNATFPLVLFFAEDENRVQEKHFL